MKMLILLSVISLYQPAADCQQATPLLQHFRKGINIGTWISQYNVWHNMNFDTFIQEKDIKQIASWGLDHVRLPVDCDFIEENTEPYRMKQTGLAYIDETIKCCRKYNLGIIIDLHKAPGFNFENGLTEADKQKNTLFSNEALQKRYINIWKTLANRYHGEKNVIFELLNEVTGVEASDWNALAKKAVDAIHSVDAQRIVMIGGLNFNSIYQLKNIAILDDPFVVYTFHFYDPLIFTHQGAAWVKAGTDYNRPLEYPGEFQGLDEFLEKYPEHNMNLARYLGKRNDKNTMRLDLQPAVDFIKTTGKEVYCGEFGVYYKTSLPSRVAWFTDLIGLFNELGIPRAVWNYKDPYFFFADSVSSKPVSNELIKIISR